MYEVPREPEPGGCGDVFVLTRSVLGVLVPILAAMIAVLVLVALAIVLFAEHPALALIPVALLVGGVLLFARWDQTRNRPPER